MALDKKFEHLKIKIEAIIFATNNFAKENCIGKGGFGKVFKGELIHSEGNTTVALKQLDRKFGQGEPEFWKEIITLSRYRHANVVSLLGFCNDNGEKILVYEYAEKKSLDKYLNSKDLTWIDRLNICIGAASGLTYLHNPGESHQRLLHRDIKSSNILLDKNWNAKISDFGLSKFGPANQEDTFLVSHTVGTLGYCDPLYIESGFLTKESDVYSFGVVLFEMLCGRLCTESNGRYRSFTRLVRDHYELNKMDDIVYSNMKNLISPDSLKAFTTIAYQCLDMDHGQRPKMIKVHDELKKAFQYQISYHMLKTRYVWKNNKVIINTGYLLDIEPQHELLFTFESRKQLSSVIHLKNKTDSRVAFKVKNTRTINYSVQPPSGIVLPHGTCDLIVTMQAQDKAPPSMKSSDKFLILMAVVNHVVRTEDLTNDQLFNKESGNQVDERRLTVAFIAPPQTSSHLRGF